MASETFVIAGGGTGGHLYPGIAIAEELAARRRGVEIVFAGAGTELERSILSAHGYRLIAIASGGVVGKSLAGRALARAKQDQNCDQHHSDRNAGLAAG